MGTIQLFYSLREEGNQKQFQLSASLEMMKRVTENCLIDILFTDAENGHLWHKTAAAAVECLFLLGTTFMLT